jgi:hypothetical protein
MDARSGGWRIAAALETERTEGHVIQRDPTGFVPSSVSIIHEESAIEPLVLRLAGSYDRGQCVRARSALLLSRFVSDFSHQASKHKRLS